MTYTLRHVAQFHIRFTVASCVVGCALNGALFFSPAHTVCPVQTLIFFTLPAFFPTRAVFGAATGTNRGNNHVAVCADPTTLRIYMCAGVAIIVGECSAQKRVQTRLSSTKPGLLCTRLHRRTYVRHKRTCMHVKTGKIGPSMVRRAGPTPRREASLGALGHARAGS